jgi:hypothetical protein
MSESLPRATLLAIRDRDPDGGEHREPSDIDRARFRAWVTDAYGPRAWDTYLSNWDAF